MSVDIDVLLAHRAEVAAARREGMVAGLGWALEQAMKSADRIDAEHRIRAEIERLREEQVRP